MDNKEKEISTFLNTLNPETFEKLTQFVQDFDPKDLKSTTRASPILVGGVEEIDIARLDPKDVEKYLWMHPVVPRGIEIKANRMIRRGYTVSPPSDSAGAKKATLEMKNLLENSGGLISIKKWIEDGYGFGTGFKTLVPNKTNTKILKLNPEHPIYFRISRYPDNYKDKDLKNKMIIDPKTKEPPYYNHL